MLGSALRKVCSIDDDAMHLGHAAQIVHKEMFEFMDPLSHHMHVNKMSYHHL